MGLDRHSLRRAMHKVGRRLRHLAGRPDNAPWVLLPRRSRGRASYADFVFALDYLSTNAPMLRLMHEAFSAYGLSVLLVNKNNVERATRDVAAGRLHPHVYLDLSSRPGCPFERLLYQAAQQGIYTIRRPEEEQFVNKATSHVIFERAGLPVPPTIFFKPGEPDRDLTADERRRLGDRCVIKPSFGEAAKGVKLDQPPTQAAISAARDYNRDDQWLVQKMIHWTRCGERPAYLRAYSICGRRSLLWWSTERHGYDLLSWQDVHRYDLLPALDLVARVAQVTKMDFFSTELAAVEGDTQRFWMIDYCNDQCDVDAEGGATGSPPRTWTRWVYRQFAELTWRLKHSLPRPDDGAICLPTTTE